MIKKRFLKRVIFGIIILVTFIFGLKIYLNSKNVILIETLNFLNFPQNNNILTLFTHLNSWLYDFIHFNAIRNRAYYLNEVNNKLYQQILELRNLQNENETLRAALKLRQEKQWNLVPAQVIFVDPTGLTGNIWINKGLKDGVKKGMNVILANKSLIGITSECFDYYCKVETILSPQINISAQDINSNTVAIVTKDIRGQYLFKLVPHNANVLSGDILVTSNENQKYLKGLIIGKVNNLISEEMTLKEYSVDLPFEISNLNNVLVITNFISPND
ncbi:MAG: rod shape-determining protein MreC [Minisyncoccia bacterium]|jgi:rod shape-determining protein MreC